MMDIHIPITVIRQVVLAMGLIIACLLGVWLGRVIWKSKEDE